MNTKLLRLAWIDQITSDPKKTADFYSELLGFQQMEVSEPNHCTSYAMTNDEGEEVMGIVDETNFQNWARGWVAYFEVEDIEKSCKKAQELGAEITMRGKGQCLVKDPAGSPIVLLQSPKEKD